MLRSFGQVLVTAGGTPVRATANEPDPTARVPLQSLRIQVRPANAGIVYVFAGGSGFSGDHRVDRDQCIAILTHPTSATDGPFDKGEWGVLNAPVGLNLADIWIDAASNGDGVIISGMSA